MIDKQGIKSPGVGGVGVEDLIAFLEEHTQARALTLRHLVLIVRHFFLRLIVVHDRSNIFIIADMEIPIEIITIAAHPREGPFHSLIELLNLLIRRARHQQQCRVSAVQMPQVGGHVICHEGTSTTANLILRPKHEVVNDQLLATIEEVCKSDGAVGTSEGVLLVDFDHGEVLELRVQLIIGAHSGLFFDKEGFAGCDPFGWGYDFARHVGWF